MKKFWTALLLITAMVFSLSACIGGTENETGDGKEKDKKGYFGTAAKDIYFYNDLSVQDVMLDDFDTEKYDVDEYAGFLQRDLDTYNASAKFVPQTAAEGEENFTPHYTVPVFIAACDAKDNQLNQQLLYATAADFIAYQTAYNEEDFKARGGNTLQAGKLSAADSSVKGASLVDPDSQEGGTLDIQSIITGEEVGRYRYIICNFDAVIYGDGEVVGYTSNASYDKEKDSVTVPAGKTVVIVYKQ